jgi:hypothetical protein
MLSGYVVMGLEGLTGSGLVPHGEGDVERVDDADVGEAARHGLDAESKLAAAGDQSVVSKLGERRAGVTGDRGGYGAAILR